MAQVKIYGNRQRLDPNKQVLSDAIHASVVDALNYPVEKRFHRFMLLDEDDFIYPPDRSQDYTILEISMFAGRSVEAKKKLIRLLYQHIGETCGISANDLEITIFETPKENWGIRGQPGDELALGYQVDV
jgi:phenylpyruvate tautomerase PptA (4-oxalocrotonate tautomerase family)